MLLYSSKNLDLRFVKRSFSSRCSAGFLLPVPFSMPQRFAANDLGEILNGELVAGDIHNNFPRLKPLMTTLERIHAIRPVSLNNRKGLESMIVQHDQQQRTGEIAIFERKIGAEVFQYLAKRFSNPLYGLNVDRHSISIGVASNWPSEKASQ